MQERVLMVQGLQYMACSSGFLGGGGDWFNQGRLGLRV